LLGRGGAPSGKTAVDPRFVALFEYAPVGVSIEDMSGRFLWVNPELEAMLGYSAVELAAMTRLEITPPAGLAAYLPQFAELMSGRRRRVDVTLAQRHRDGHTIWTRLTATPIDDQSEGVASILCMSMDVTELVAARDSLGQLQTAVEAATDGMTIVGDDGRIRFANPAYAAMRNAKDASFLLGQRWLEAYPGREAGRISGELARGHGRWRGEVRAENKDGASILEDISATPLPGGGMVLITRDLSARERAEQERERLREQITQSQKMEAVARMAGGVAHDFNNLLAAILNYSEIVREELAEDHPARLYADRIHQAGKKGEALVRQILSLRQGVPSERVPVELAEIVQEAVAGVRPAIHGGTKIVIVGALPSELVVLGSPVQIEQVIINLCINAVHACEEMTDAEVRVSLSAGPAPQQLANTAATALATDGRLRLLIGTPDHPGDFARFTVADSGTGMSRETAQRMFDPFFTTKPVGRGTGIGLAAVQSIVQAHGGAIEVITAPARGTSMTVHLPLYHGTADSVQTAGRERILLVDDDADARAATRRMIERLGYGVFEAENMASAMVLLQEPAPVADLVVTDYLMPGGLGTELAAMLAQHRPYLPVILCSGNLASLDISDLAAANIAATLEKPVQARKLARTLRQVLDKSKAD
jgi:PAS domain S-box-containing protein